MPADDWYTVSPEFCTLVTTHTQNPSALTEPTLAEKVDALGTLVRIEPIRIPEGTQPYHTGPTPTNTTAETCRVAAARFTLTALKIEGEGQK